MNNSNPTLNQNIFRGTVIQLIVSALQNEKYLFGRQLCEKWLSVFPGDLSIQYYLAVFLVKEKRDELAIEVFGIKID